MFTAQFTLVLITGGEHKVNMAVTAPSVRMLLARMMLIIMATL